ncbi:MAG: rod shape-determining protein MreC [Oscillospiraceae bacterium]|nr:rod shape-determining protein MreC [Oscillospiraceae bacterium]
MKAYLKQYGVRVLILVLIAALIVGLATREKEDAATAGALEEASNRLSAPVQRAVGSMVGWLEGLYGYIYDYNQLVQENEALRAQLADAQEEARSAAEANEENERLRALLGYLEKHTSYITESAQITAWDASNWVRAFTISKGSNHGIEKGDCVITEDGSLVGQVAELGTSWATVRTVIDVNMDVGVLVGDGEIAAVVVGDYALMQDGLCKLTYFTEDVTLFVGDRVVTSGNGGAFPPNIALGTVTELRSEAGGQSYYAVVEPDVNISMLSQIFIIKDFEVIE